VAPCRKQPHIYNDAEIRSLLQQASRMRPRGGLCAKTYVAFFALLLSTGLRLSEACRLTCGDVDLDRGLLTIRGTKFRKSRYVPLHASTTRALTQYAADRDAIVPSDPSSFFFRTQRVRKLKPDTVQKALRLDQGQQPRPRDHCVHLGQESLAPRHLDFGLPRQAGKCRLLHRFSLTSAVAAPLHAVSVIRNDLCRGSLGV
jgi:integrase